MQSESAIPATAADAPDWRLDRSSPVPLYVQIKQRLLPEIAHWPDSRRFYTDLELCSLFSVNRLTVRQAAFLAAQKPLAAALAAAGVRIRSVAATSGAARQSLGPAVKKH